MCLAFLKKESQTEIELREIKKRLKVLEDIGINHTTWFMSIDENLKTILEGKNDGRKKRRH